MSKKRLSESKKRFLEGLKSKEVKEDKENFFTALNLFMWICIIYVVIRLDRDFLHWLYFE